ncbi:YgcG family protein [Ferruginibacter sp. HRS2-29]|uniref:TPM domain-containing protein n=1 Tax=Ferruginibacter sp. HRS2-29 TaxID=2487334 RepID=UPI0020CB76A5|nr:TPM domain-containing protein [Ferruginibacter sp. HRS2-29]MCP9751913.1 TPM domain-containing protein [Ferruginibacter sp. HRS2-29]
MKKLFYILVFLFSALMSFAQRPFKSMEDVIANPPSPAMAVVDYTTTLTSDQQYTLENKIQQLYQSSSIQIEVVIVPKLDGMDVSDAGIELGRKWGVGNKKDNSGFVLLISKDDRKLSISPGYGLEGALTDVESDDIIQQVIVPKFKGDDYYRGIDEGVDAIIQAVQGTFKTPAPKSSSRGFSIIPIIVIIVIIILLSSRGGGGRGGSFMSSRGAIPFIIGNMLGGGGGGSGWSGGGGSSGGGGFSGGFGGGSFGGGGSSGSW